MAIFNVTENMTNVVQVLTEANNFADGAVGLGILLMVFFGTLFLTSAFSIKESMIASSFIAMVIALILRFLDLIDDLIMWLFGVIFISIILWSFSTKTGGVGA